jgi:glucose/arabinose dehydrogenase
MLPTSISSDGGFADGLADHARFNGPVGVRVLADGSILVADTSNHVVRRLVSSPLPPRRRTVR